MLDVSIRVGILNLMKALKQERNIGFLYITHDLASARYIADRTLVLYAGQVVEEASSVELMREPLHPYTRLLLSAVPRPGGNILSPWRQRAVPRTSVSPALAVHSLLAARTRFSAAER
ncbi:MAG: ABC transporter ATP-binding protein [Polyangiaceae bacterium]